MKQVILIFIWTALLSGCASTKIYSDDNKPLSIDNLSSIVIEINANKKFFITKKREMKDFVVHINNARVNGSWKGAEWDKIIINYEDEKIVFNSNGQVFGQGSSGTYYNLDPKYKHYW